MNLGEIRQEVAGMEGRAITCTDDPHIKVLFSSTHKSRDSYLASIFSLLVWLGGWIEQCISATLPSLLSSRLKMEGKHHLTLQLATQLPEYLFSLQLQAQDK